MLRMLPLRFPRLWLGLGWAAVVFAIVVIGGLTTSTILSLVVIPVVFTFVDDLLEVLKHRVSGTRAAQNHTLRSNET